jgi:hypothetical protein
LRIQARAVRQCGELPRGEQAAFEQRRADTQALPPLHDAEGDLGLAPVERSDNTQIGGAAQHSVQRQIIRVNLPLGLLVVIIGGSGRYMFFDLVGTLFGSPRAAAAARSSRWRWQASRTSWPATMRPAITSRA